uniref:Uncharacterized protein n=1 Tax=Anguilla anguilla TaxID=7936 RepID=A0A0E9V5M7_ANGAN
MVYSTVQRLTVYFLNVKAAYSHIKGLNVSKIKLARQSFLQYIYQKKGLCPAYAKTNASMRTNAKRPVRDKRSGAKLYIVCNQIEI